MSAKQEKTDTALSAGQKKYLKGVAHSLKALVHIGKEGISPGVFNSISSELTNHELVKIKIGGNNSIDRHQASKAIAADTGSTLIQLVGKTFVLYRANPKKAKDKRIRLPAL